MLASWLAQSLRPNHFKEMIIQQVSLFHLPSDVLLALLIWGFKFFKPQGYSFWNPVIFGIFAISCDSCSSFINWSADSYAKQPRNDMSHGGFLFRMKAFSCPSLTATQRSDVVLKVSIISYFCQYNRVGMSVVSQKDKNTFNKINRL